MLKFLARAGVLSACVLAATPSLAGVYNMSVVEGMSNGSGFNTTNVSQWTAGPNVATASFTYTGNLNFSDTTAQNTGPGGDWNSTFGFSATNMSSYTGSGTVASGGPIANYATTASFLGSSGSSSNFEYGSWYKIDLGTLVAGTVLDIIHDDGVSVYQGNTSLGNPKNGPTVKTEDFIDITATGDTYLYYSRQNGSPSILDVSVPEPSSIALFGIGLLGLTMLVRRRAA